MSNEMSLINPNKNTMKTKFWLSFLTLVGLFSTNQAAQAQTYQPTNRIPVADQTLGTQVLGNGNNFDITGGLSKGQTLFHSFTDFSIPTNGQANFLNPVGNRDIITRVTGNLFSDINGLVNTNGANFFLINPAGIVFGNNAQLNVGKAFVGSTANSLDLVGGGRSITFGTNSSGDAPLLSVAPNVLFDVSRLNLGSGSGAISNFGTLETTNPGQYIGLIGGNVNLNGGQLFAPGGTVELGGLSQAGTVEFSLDRGVQLPDNITRGNVSLVQTGEVPSIIDARAGGGGNVRIFAKDIDLQGAGSYIATGIDPGFGSPTAQAGDIKLDATGKVTISAGSIFNQVAAGEIGNGGNIEIKTGNLAITNAAKLAASNFGQGDAGSIKITATDNIFFDGFGSGAVSIVGQKGVGKGGNIEIKTGKLAVTNGVQLIASTFGQGDAGSIKIAAAGDILFDGSTASSTVELGAVGKGGNIEITTGNLAVINTAKLAAGTFGQGDAGSVKITAAGNILFDGIKNGVSSGAYSTVEPGAVGKGSGIEIKTGNLTVTNAALLDASTGGQGDAGNIKITATNILFDGGKDGFNSGAGNVVRQGAVGKGGGLEIKTGNLALTNGGALIVSTAGQGDAGNIKITAAGDISIDGSGNGESSGVFSNISGAVSTRKGGEVEINARNLSIANGGALTTGSLFGNGNGGSIFINTNNLTLNNSSIIESLSLRGIGGDINITTKDYLLIRNNTSIQTTSFSSDKNGNGGNITINSPLIIATPGNNDISANADVGNGGRVSINSQGLFGIQYRPKGQESPLTNDITASSTFGRDGAVNISTPGTDPGKNNTELPKAPTDASNQISQVCSANSRQNKLTVTGRGGLPPNANDPLTGDVIWQDDRAASTPLTANRDKIPVKLTPPAVGWVFNRNGKVTLVAAANQGQPTGTSVICPSAGRQ
jgi:filamentous hemagglutinin family protein